MKQLNELYQSDDWKTEKHVPVIDAPDSVTPGDYFKVSVTVGKEVAHPNTIPHHIRWIELFFLADDKKLPVQIGRFEFDAHGDHELEKEEAGIFTHSCAATQVRIDGPGTLMASAYCNIHGLWQSAKSVACK